MVSFVRSSIARMSLLAAALLVCAAVYPAEAQQSLRHLDNKDLTDLLDAKLDESFLHKVDEDALRRLQSEEDDDLDAYGDADDEGTTMDEPMETASPTSSPTGTFAPSFAPTMEDGSRGLGTSSPSSSPTMTPTEASGASSWGPSTAGVAALSLIMGVASAFAMA